MSGPQYPTWGNLVSGRIRVMGLHQKTTLEDYFIKKSVEGGNHNFATIYIIDSGKGCRG
jgi:hypothetical protein